MNKNSIAMQALSAVESIEQNDFACSIMTDCVGRCCFVGHMHRLNSKNPSNYQFLTKDIVGANRLFKGRFLKAFYKSFEEFFQTKYHTTTSVSFLMSINDMQTNPFYKQSTVKERIVALLTDMIEEGY